MATLTVSGAAVIKAGTSVSASVPSASWDTWIEEAEGFLSSLLKFDVVAGWATISGSASAPMLSDYCARDAAIQGISYDMSGYTTILEAEDMINVHLYKMNETVQKLKNASRQDFMEV